MSKTIAKTVAQHIRDKHSASPELTTTGIIESLAKDGIDVKSASQVTNAILVGSGNGRKKRHLKMSDVDAAEKFLACSGLEAQAGYEVLFAVRDFLNGRPIDIGIQAVDRLASLRGETIDRSNI